MGQKIHEKSKFNCTRTKGCFRNLNVNLENHCMIMIVVKAPSKTHGEIKKITFISKSTVYHGSLTLKQKMQDDQK